MENQEFTNHLIHESSPYLLQHAHNPVDWYPWGEEAFAKARAENKPVLLSIGYSACHWCHVMAHESFEDEEIARLMNENFVNIKVDREERPDLDQIYMSAVQMMTHHGGWPMTVFLTPEGVPFYGGTYFPPQDRYNIPGFPRVLISLAEAYRDRPQDIAETGTSLLAELRRLSQSSGSDNPIEKELLDAAYAGIVRSYDATNGGFGGAPKFPPAMTLEFLLRTYARNGNKDALRMVSHTCRKMAEGGMYDQLGGGFHRYSTDARWLVPHFEKMLYDNALLSRLYLHHFQVTQFAPSRATVEGILDYVLREMTDADGGFYSTQDADSEGHEGKFFVWDVAEIRSALGEPAAALFCDYYDITEGGNFEGKNIPNVTRTIEDVAVANRVSVDELRDALARGKQILFELREKRIKPDRDEKILTAWNGLMLASFAEAGVVLKRPDYTNAARRNAEFVLTHLLRDGLLLRTYKDGVAKFNAYLEDYAFLIEGLVTLYETTGELRWFNEAVALADRMIEEFWDDQNGGFYFTGKSHENLIVRSKDYFDNATPSGNSVAAGVLLRLAILSGNENYRNLAIAVFREAGESARRYPSGFGYLLSAIDFLLSTPKEVVIVGQNETDIEPLLAETWRPYLPNKVVAPSFAGETGATTLPLLQDRPLTGGRATAYVCEHYTCKQPVTEPADLAAQLRPEARAEARAETRTEA
ncbi:MAG TPA: thioredoxin domain-containing protein [Pyrinomonadaceae bacterium]|nr:thioredoxin domain-containing protein [Pyrinomonadaceae bacterium]